jgi:hypothetical protein
MRVFIGICILTGLTSAASADPRAMMMMQGAWLQGRSEARPAPTRHHQPSIELRVAPRTRPLVLKRNQVSRAKADPAAGVRRQQVVKLAASLKYAWSQAKQQRCAAPKQGSLKPTRCKAKSLNALVKLCQKVKPGEASKTSGCKLGLIAGLVKRVKRIAKRASSSIKRASSSIKLASSSIKLAGLLEPNTDRPVARYNAAVPGSLTEIQAGILLSPLRMGLLRPVQPRTLELLRIARLISEREYLIVRERTSY